MIRKPNRLIDSTSPYLQQHAHNPVDWYPWCEEALKRARQEDKPILLSIGYSACHWCHVMAHESFENEVTAALMNESFVNIKVDREERPDLDQLYMRAVQLLVGVGGWPLTVFLTPGLVPFHGGTYFPPEDRNGMPGFPHVLQTVKQAYAERRDDVAAAAGQLLVAIRDSSTITPNEGDLSEEMLTAAVKSCAARLDMEWGGFGHAPKFPQATVLDWLLRYWSRAGDQRALLMVTLSLDKMAAGGLFDQLGGGFHRYAIDRQWQIPHFEKMLYDNAQLAALYANAFRATRRVEYREVATATADYVLENLRHPDGGFYSAQSADSDGVEGAYYVWEYQQILECLGTEAGRTVAQYLGATEEGNFEGGLNVLGRPGSPSRPAAPAESGELEGKRAIGRGIRRLALRRQARTPPCVDTKVMTDSNALMATGLLSVHRATGDLKYLNAARKCIEFVLTVLTADGALMHTWREGRTEVPAFLADHSLLAGALIDLYESTFEIGYLRRARELAAEIVGEFWDAESGFFHETGPASERLFAPLGCLSDQPSPSGASAACHVLLRLAALGDRENYRDIAERQLRNRAASLAEAPLENGHMLSAALRCLSPPQELIVIGVEGQGAGPLRDAADDCYMPHLVRFSAGQEDVADLSAEFPLLAGKEAIGGRPTAYLCSGGTCQRPVQKPAELRQQLTSLAEETQGRYTDGGVHA